MNNERLTGSLYKELLGFRHTHTQYILSVKTVKAAGLITADAFTTSTLTQLNISRHIYCSLHAGTVTVSDVARDAT